MTPCILDGNIPLYVIQKSVVGNDHIMLSWRTYLGLTVELVASKMGITVEQYKEIESEPSQYTTRMTLSLFADALGLVEDQVLLED